MDRNPDPKIVMHRWPRWTLWATAVLPPLVWCVWIWHSYAHRRRFLQLVREDGLIENLQVVCLLVAVVLGGRIAYLLRRAGEQRFAILYGVGALLLFVVAGEEISWGQRIFSMKTPEWLPNAQGETNLHNLGGVMFILGTAIEYTFVLVTVCSLVVWMVDRSLIVRWRAHLWLPSPVLIPLWLCFLTNTNGTVRKAYRLWDPAEADIRFGVLSSLQEPAELIMMFGGVLFLIMTLGRIRHAETAPEIAGKIGDAERVGR